ncbi:MAG: FlgD immunoglobulin-like domain containing protein [Bacteroidia bacterium]
MKWCLYLILALGSANLNAQIFYKDVAPVFQAKCTRCHNENSHAASLQYYGQIYAKKATVSNYLSTGYMPPWRPDTTYRRYVGEHIITLSEKNLILNWIGAGAPAGDTTVVAPPHVYTRNQINAPADLELTIPTFTSNALNSDSHDCFSLPTGLQQDRIIRAYEIVAGNASIVHHVVASIDTGGSVTSNTSGNCFTPPGGYIIGGFAPGSAPCIFPNSPAFKIGIPLKAGSNIILQIHYPANTIGQVDSTKIRLFFYPVGIPGVRPLYSKTAIVNNFLTIPANSVVDYAAQYGINHPISLFSVFPHSHYLATKIIDYAFNSVDTIPLIRINKWDFNFQQFYVFRNLVKLGAGRVIYGKHTFDNTSNNPNNPNSPPQPVVYGTNSTDEMLHDALQWLDYKSGDEYINIDSLLANDPLVNVLNPATVNNLSVRAFPNPFENNVNFEYELNYPAKVSVEIFSLLGIKIRTLKNSYDGAGVYDVIWDGKNNEGSTVSAGNYFYVISAGDKQTRGKLSFTGEKK